MERVVRHATVAQKERQSPTKGLEPLHMSSVRSPVFHIPKVREEAEEVVVAARDESDAALAHEVADLLFHVWVLMASRGVEPSSVCDELASRFGIGGLEEKASRLPKTGDERR